MSKQRQSQDRDGRAASRTQAGQLRHTAVAKQDACIITSSPSHVTSAATSGRNGCLPSVEASRHLPQLIPSHSQSFGGTAMPPHQAAHPSGRQLGIRDPLIGHPQHITTDRATANQQNRESLASPHAGTFAGPAGNWRAYDRREVDAYHGLLSLRYGPLVEAPSISYSMTTRETSGGGANFPAHSTGAASDTRQLRPRIHDGNNVMGSSGQMIRPAGPQSAHKQAPSPADQGDGHGQDARRARDPPRRYSCYMCEWTGLGFSWARNHMMRRHGLNESEMDYQRIQESEVVCLW